MSDETRQRLEQAYRDLNYLQPLQPGDRRLAAELFEQSLLELSNEVLLTRTECRKLLIHGHVGSGKSTFLNCLQQRPELQTAFLVVPLDIKDVSEPDDVDVIDLLLGFVTAALAAAEAAHIDLSSDDLPDAVALYKELRGLVKVEELHARGRDGSIEAAAGVSIPAIVAWLRAGFQVNYRVSVENRRKVRETFAPRIGNLIERTNTTLSAIEARLGEERRLLFLVHDTDKPALRRAIHLLEGQGYQLTQVQAAAVIVIDKAVACSSSFATITNRLGAARPFPAFKIVEKDGGDSSSTRRHCRLLAELLCLRLPADLVADRVTERIIELGGGHLRETLRIGREAVLKTIHQKGEVVTLAEVKYAAIQRANDFNLTRQQWRILKEVLGEPRWCPDGDAQIVEAPDSPFLRLLNNVALLEYTNAEEKWLRPHPVLIPRAQAL